MVKYTWMNQPYWRHKRGHKREHKLMAHNLIGLKSRDRNKRIKGTINQTNTSTTNRISLLPTQASTLA
jgi:hypothetical protein